ncbi:GpE family phage tail protein [Xenophilus aerolatus]|nr:GpE family phage tail protein [Xenophilus aerolatus]
MADCAFVFHWRPADMDPMPLGELMDWREAARKRYAPKKDED